MVLVIMAVLGFATVVALTILFVWGAMKLVFLSFQWIGVPISDEEIWQLSLVIAIAAWMSLSAIRR